MTSNTVLASLPDFKLFNNATAGGSAVLTRDLATDYKVAITAAETFYSDLAGTTVDIDGIITGAKLTVSGSQLTTLTPAITTATLDTGTTAAVANFTCDETCTDALIAGTPDFSLTQTSTTANQQPIQPGSYTTSALFHLCERL